MKENIDIIIALFIGLLSMIFTNNALVGIVIIVMLFWISYRIKLDR